MKFRLIQQTSNPAQSPVRVVEQTTGRVDRDFWIVSQSLLAACEGEMTAHASGSLSVLPEKYAKAGTGL